MGGAGVGALGDVGLARADLGRPPSDEGYRDPMARRLVIVGGGNMGAALAGGLIASGMAADELAISEALPERRQALEAMFPGVLVSSEVAAADSALIAVKPGDVAAAIGAAVAAGAGRILSIAAGVRLASLEAAAGPDVAVVRAMPNTPALIREGASAIAGGTRAGETRPGLGRGGARRRRHRRARRRATARRRDRGQRVGSGLRVPGRRGPRRGGRRERAVARAGRAADDPAAGRLGRAARRRGATPPPCAPP